MWIKEAAGNGCIMCCAGSTLRFSADVGTGFWTTTAGAAECCHTTAYDDKGNMVISTIVHNHTDKPLPLQDLPFIGEVMVSSVNVPLTHAFVECQALLGDCGPQELELDKVWYSWGIAGLTDRQGRQALLFGVENVDDHFYHFTMRKTSDGIAVTPVCPREGILLASGESLELSRLIVYAGTSLSAMLADHASRMAEGHKPRVEGDIKTGWCSWYHYYSTESQEDILRNAADLSQSPLRLALDVILLDDGWNLPDNEHPCVWGDWEAGGKFPEGMQAVAKKIHDTGFEAGLWLAPFAVAKDSRLFKDHPDWVIGAGEGLVNNNASVFGLDVTHPEARRFLKDTFQKVFDEWKYDYIKIDFLLYAIAPGKRYDPSMTTAQILRRGVEIIRECAGDKFILGCGTPLLQLIGLCDGMRIGPDVGGQWSFPLNHPAWPLGNCSIKPCARYAVYRHWQHRVFWQNDPDCIVVRDHENGIEGDQFRKFFPHMYVKDENFGLTDAEASLWVKIIWFTGGMWFLSEDWAQLNEDRKKLVEMCATPNSRPVRMTDYYNSYYVMVMESADGAGQFAVINIGDEKAEVELDATRYQLTEWTFREVFTGETFTGKGKSIRFPVIPPHTAMVYEIVR